MYLLKVHLRPVGLSQYLVTKPQMKRIGGIVGIFLDDFFLEVR